VNVSRTFNIIFPSDNFKKYIVTSIILHFLVLMFFTIKTVFFSGEPIEYQAAIQVDLIALPDKLNPQELPAEIVNDKSEPEKPETTLLPEKKIIESAKEIAKDKDTINLEKKKKQDLAMQKMKQMTAMEEIKKQVDQDNKNKAIEKLKQIKGNVLSSGSEVTGVTKLQHDNYISLVERHIRKNWSLPQWLSNKSLAAQVRIKFDENGLVTFKEIYKSSGNPSFDEIVIATVEMSSPVPIPPAKFVRILNVEGILLGFPE
jgi:colicin import membrane protein